jgi:PII-like signaling protein
VSGAGQGRSEGLELRFHFGERDRDGDGPLDAAVMEACERSGVWAAALLRGIEGFGAKQRERTDRLLSLSEDAPLVAVAVGEAAVIEGLAEEVRGIAGGGLLTLAPTGPATPSAAMVAGPVGGSPGDLVRATIWGDRSGPRSPHLRAVDALYRHGADCATVLLGVDGVLDGERRRARFVAANRGVPAMTVAVGERAAIDAALAEVGASANLVTIEAVEPFLRIEKEKLHGDEAVERKWRISPPTHHGARVTLVTSEIARCDSHPLYLEFVHALRRAGAPGATALRGVWGFRGEVEPHGDRVLALRRDVPVIVETVDPEERASRWLELAEELAGAPEVVYSQRALRILPLD